MGEKEKWRMAMRCVYEMLATHIAEDIVIYDGVNFCIICTSWWQRAKGEANVVIYVYRAAAAV